MVASVLRLLSVLVVLAIGADAHGQGREPEDDPMAPQSFVDGEGVSEDVARTDSTEPDVFETTALREAPQARLSWPEEWGSFGLWDYGLLGGAMAVTVGTQLVGPLNVGDPRAGTGWQTTSRFDDVVRRNLRRDDLEERSRVRDASDLVLSLAVSFPFLFDGLVSAFWYHESPEVGRELTLLAIEVQFVTAAIQSTANMLASRVRPYVRDCGGELAEDNGDCTGSVRFRSYFSGHTSQAFAGAVTSCVFHAKFPLYGGGSKDVLPCIGLLAGASAVGVFRMMGDMHYVTDVLSGALVGTAVGLALPLLRMRNLERGRHVSIVPNGLGLAVVGSLR
ncbi:MAG: phosphatase PAP2 family protein [Deltaproteobacteria bacterium]|nr:phosphatase PAP2 family protein [Deltaproteobacteria bacterium]